MRRQPPAANHFIASTMMQLTYTLLVIFSMAMLPKPAYSNLGIVAMASSSDAVSALVASRAQSWVENVGRKTEEKIRSWLGLVWKDGTTSTDKGNDYFVVYHESYKNVPLEPKHKLVEVYLLVLGTDETLHERIFNVEGRSWEILYQEAKAKVAAYKHMLPRVRGEL